MPIRLPEISLRGFHGHGDADKFPESPFPLFSGAGYLVLVCGNAQPDVIAVEAVALNTTRAYWSHYREDFKQGWVRSAPKQGSEWLSWKVLLSTWQ